MFTVAIVGRPNVGKSTLFNKLVGKSLAIVDDYAGVTRDRKESVAHLGSMEFIAIDTAGWENNLKKEQLESRMVEQTEIAITCADLCLFMIDNRAGITPVDKFFAEKLRKLNVPVVLLANKCEGSRFESSFDSEYYKLGFGEPVGISAEHNDGFNFLYDAIEPYYNTYNEKHKGLKDIVSNVAVNSELDDKVIQIAIVGRPNAGKSTLINQLLNEERVVTGAEAGITRDSISIDWNYNGKKIKLVDTAGIRKKKNIDEKLEKLSVAESFRSINFAQIVLLLMDAERCFDSQDLAIASKLVEEGRGVVFVLNKWDKINVEDKQSLMNRAINIVEKNVPEIKGAPIIPISALNGTNTDKLMKSIFDVYESWGAYIKTSKLNEWMKIAIEEHTPPLFKGVTTKLKYITQAKKRPPTFVLFTNSPERLRDTSYDRYLVNSLRDYFNLKGTVVRLLMRKSDNPYANKKEKKHLKEKLNTKSVKKR